MISLSWRHLMSQRRQLLGVALAIALSVAFLVITQMTGTTLRDGLQQAVGRNYQHIDLALTLDGDGRQFTADDLAEIAALPGVAETQPATSFGAPYHYQGTSSFFSLTRTPTDGAMQDALLLERGAWPTAPDEIVLVDNVARDARVDVGDTIDVVLPPNGESTSMVVTGIWSGDGHFGADFIDGFVSAKAWNTISESTWISGIYVTLDEGADSSAVEQEIATLDLPGFAVQSRQDLVDVELQDAQEQLQVLNTGVTAFALLTVIVASLVVANTFAILIAQRTRDIALLRCAGATVRQVRRLVLTEAALIGAVAAVIGLVVAWLMGSAILATIHALWSPGFLPRSAALPVTAPFIAIGAGVVLAVGSAWVPSRTAMQIDPLVALRAAQAVDSPLSRSLRTGLGVLGGLAGIGILLGGMAMSWSGNPALGTLVGIVGGAISFAGVVLCASAFVPVVARLFGRVAERIGGIPARVAASNAIRNPRRTTATAVALVIGVTLVAMMMVGAESLRQTLLGDVDARAPIDFQVTFIDDSEAATREAFVADVSAVEGVAAIATINSLEVTFVNPESGVDSPARLGYLDPVVLEQVWRDKDALPLATNTLLAPSWLLEVLELNDGGEVVVQVGGTETTLMVVEDARIDEPTTVPAHLVANVDTTPTSLWIGYSDDADADAVVAGLFAEADQHGVLLESLDVYDYRQALESALDTMLLVVVGLLAVAIVISLIGVTNTLSLSVLERTRESALLRALGFTRSQLRWSLAVEGLLLAAVGASVGVVLGIGYGWVGTVTLVGDTFTPALAIPWGRLTLVLLVALGCGLLASVLPARRAAEADPVVALADR